MTINSSTIPTKSANQSAHISQEEETEQDEESAWRPETKDEDKEEELKNAACTIIQQVEQDQHQHNVVKPFSTSSVPSSPALPHVEISPSQSQETPSDAVKVCAVKSDKVIPVSVQEAFHGTTSESVVAKEASLVNETQSVPTTPEAHKKATEPTEVLESPCRPPASPTLTHEIPITSKPLLSPENPKIVFGCLDDELVTSKKLITVCMHGDEICGMIAANRLIQEGFFDSYFSKKGAQTKRLTIIVANPKGVQANKRFIDVNLNRIFHERRLRRTSTAGLLEMPKDLLYNDKVIKEQYEVTRVQVLADEIAECDEYIDIHSTSAKSYPFALPALDADSEAFARSFAVDFVIEQLVKSVRGTSIGWAHALNKKAVCFECGQHEDPNTTEIAKKLIMRFVTEILDGTAGTVLTCRSNEVIRKGFRWNRKAGPPKAFEKVQPNELLAYDEEVGDIKCNNPRGAYIIMPTANPILGEEAWFWGDLKDIRARSAPDLMSVEKFVSDPTSVKPFPTVASHTRTLEVR